MRNKLGIAIGIQVLIMILVLVPPLVLKATGQVVYLETEKMDPRSLFRGDYVILGYTVGQNILSDEMTRLAQEEGSHVYVTVTTERPARFVHVSLQQPTLGPNQACIVGRPRGVWGGDDVDFPQIAQYFVPEGEGREIESARGENLLAKVKVSKKCNAVLMGLEPR